MGGPRGGLSVWSVATERGESLNFGSPAFAAVLTGVGGLYIYTL